MNKTGYGYGKPKYPFSSPSRNNSYANTQKLNTYILNALKTRLSSRKPSDHFDKQLGIQEDKTIEITWPSAELPANDLKLFSAKNKLYLVVNFREHIEQAKKDAARLGAALCVKPEQGRENA